MKLSTDIIEEPTHVSFKDALSGVSTAMTLLAAYLAQMRAEYDFDAMVTTISKSLDELSDALINYGCNSEYIASYKKWGDYGWSISPQVNNKFFLSKPLSLNDADEKMQKICTLENITEINKVLYSHGLNEEDLESARVCYENKLYKPCAMLLFSMLDCQLIDKNYFGSDKNGNPYLKTGFAAIRELKDEGEKIFDENHFLSLLQYKLIIHSLMSLFDGDKNFENEPNIINRNYLMHGKSTKLITASDCYKLWSALYSLVVAYPELEESLKNDYNRKTF